VPQIVPSAYNEGEAFVVVNNYRQNDDKPYLFQTTNYGKTWINLASANNIWGWTLSFVQDPVEPKLMFLGTEFGLYVSLNAGKSWEKWTQGYPTVSTIDLKIHPREYDLIIGTFGRSAWIIDDIRPLREMAKQGPALFDKTIVAFEPPAAVMASLKNDPGYYFTGDAYYEGENRSSGAMISYYVKEGANKDKAAGAKPEEVNKNTSEKSSVNSKPSGQDSVKIRISNSEGKIIRTITQLPEKGVNRLSWRFDRTGLKLPFPESPRRRSNEGGGPPVMPGNYTLNFYYKGDSASTMLKIEPDPRYAYNYEAMKQKDSALVPLIQKLETMSKAMAQIKECKESMQTVDKLATTEQKEVLKEITGITKKALDPVYEAFYGNEEIKGIYENPKQLTSKLYELFDVVYSDSPLTPNQLIIIDQSKKNCEQGTNMVKSFLEKEWPAYQAKVEETKVSVFKEVKEIN